ncbi:hypothetical protein BN946_scf184920.g47 [Trametes cinnabarina]|uniref:Uncharacterized protein n=1 Tax=Pycnoporus cinnabarinus TaxID=5643 RepID=A0A060SH79_PYCCI|nr:hypothetical protein BN946_scf184920.g47 [Trametes cinnabarina]
MEPVSIDLTGPLNPLDIILIKQVSPSFRQTIPRHTSAMPTFKPPESQECPACAAEQALDEQAWSAALAIQQQVEEAEKQRPETAQLETLAIVATVLAEHGQA